MTEDDDIRAWFRDEWARLDREAQRAKDSYQATRKLTELYRNLTEGERQAVNMELIEWALADDPMGEDHVASVRGYAALSLIDDFAVIEALPALRVLQHRYEHSNIPGAPAYWAQVNTIIGRLISGEGRADSNEE